MAMNDAAVIIGKAPDYLDLLRERDMERRVLGVTRDFLPAAAKFASWDFARHLGVSPPKRVRTRMSRTNPLPIGSQR